MRRASRERGAPTAIEAAWLDEPGSLRPECHIWVSHKLAWVTLGDGLPQFPEWRKRLR